MKFILNILSIKKQSTLYTLKPVNSIPDMFNFLPKIVKNP